LEFSKIIQSKSDKIIDVEFFNDSELNLEFHKC
jgi:hypothetical protein